MTKRSHGNERNNEKSTNYNNNNNLELIQVRLLKKCLVLKKITLEKRGILTIIIYVTHIWVGLKY